MRRLTIEDVRHWKARLTELLRSGAVEPGPQLQELSWVVTDMEAALEREREPAEEGS